MVTMVFKCDNIHSSDLEIVFGNIIRNLKAVYNIGGGKVQRSTRSN